MTIEQVLAILAVVLLSYLAGSIPVGWVVVKVFTGRDVRHIESGRTGGTNAMRAAGLVAGILTALGDAAKGLSTSWIVAWLITPESPWKVWIQVLAPLMAIMGHNYSIFLIERRADGKLNLRGGAGGAPCFGGAIGLWPWSGLFILPVGLLVFLLVGYASMTTLSIAVTATAVCAYLAVAKGYPWQFVLYGLASFFILGWALRPNLMRLAQGNERAVGLRAYLQKRKEKEQANKRAG
jgi:acyl phosphate:glycerol-3-phosphate acyltransferase